MEKLVVAICICVFLFVLGCKEDTTGPSETPDLWQSQPNQSIVFISKADNSEGEIYLLDKSGSVTRLTNNSRYENSPSISRDGTSIAFQAGDAADMTTWEIYIMDIGSGFETRLTNNNFIEAHPDWGPGDSSLVFSSWHDSTGAPTGAADIFSMSIDGSNVTRLTNSMWEDNDAEWSPDGELIVFKSNRSTQISGREEIYVMDADGSNKIHLTSTIGWQSDHDPSWSPDSKTIVYSHYNGSRVWYDVSNPYVMANYWQELVPWNIYSVDLQGNTEQLTDVQYMAEYTVFSDDGSSILYLDMDFYINQDGVLIGADHLLMLMSENGGAAEQMIPDDEHTGTLEYYDW